MTFKKSEKLYLVHISDAMDNIFDAISSEPDVFFKNTHIQNAVYRYFEIIGEAAARLPDEFKAKHPDINWQGMKNLRNVIIHQYDGIDPDIVWKIIQNTLTVDNKLIKKLLKDLG